MIGMLLATAKEKDTELEHLRHCGALCTELLERKEESDTVCIQYQQQTKVRINHATTTEVFSHSNRSQMNNEHYVRA